jgi:hypothetical protein
MSAAGPAFFGVTAMTPAWLLLSSRTILSASIAGGDFTALIKTRAAATKWGTKRYLQMDRLAEVVAIA